MIADLSCHLTDTDLRSPRFVSQNIICVTTASHRQLRRAFFPDMTSSIDSNNSSPGSWRSSFSNFYSPDVESVVFSWSDEDECTGPKLELHAHPKSGVMMTVMVHPVDGESESGKVIRIDMLQAGE